MAVCADEDVLRLEIAVDNSGGVKTLDALDDLGGVEPRAIAAQAAPARKLRGEITSWMEVL